MLAHLKHGHSRGDTSRWSELWIDLIGSGTSLFEAEAFFDELRGLADTQPGNNTLRVRASEGRRAYLYGMENAEHALEILRNNSYHKAIDQLPPIRGRHLLSNAKVIRKEIARQMERMSIGQLSKLLKMANELTRVVAK